MRKTEADQDEAARLPSPAQKGGLPNGASGAMRRLLLGIGSSALGQLISASQAILFVPLFLRAWGADGYGQWLALTALTSYLSLLDLGGQSYIGNLLAIDHTRGDTHAFGRKLSQAVSLFVAIALGAIAVVAGLLLGVVPVVEDRLQAERLGMLASPEARLIVLFCASALLITIPGGVLVTVYRATGQFVRGTMVGNMARLIELSLYALLLNLAVTPVLYASAILLSAVARTAFVARDILRHVPASQGISLSLRRARQGRKYLKGSLLFWLLALSGAINQHGIVLVLAAVSNPTTVAIYATHRTAAGLVSYVSAMVQAPLWPEFSRLWTEQRWDDLRRVALLALRLVPIASGVAALVLWAVLPLIYEVWTGRELKFQPVLLAVLMAQSVAASYWSTSGWSMLAANSQRLPALWSLLNAGLTIALATALAPRLGGVGAAIATLVGDLACGLLVFPVLAARFLDVRPQVLYGPLLATIALLAPPALLLAVAGKGQVLDASGLSRGESAGLAVIIAMWVAVFGRLALGQEVFKYLGRRRHTNSNSTVA